MPIRMVMSKKTVTQNLAKLPYMDRLPEPIRPIPVQPPDDAVTIQNVWDPKEGVAVVGCGRQGVLIAGELARRGCKVRVFDETDFSRDRAKNHLQAELQEQVTKGYCMKTEAKSIMARVKIADTLEEAVTDAAIVFEAVVDEQDIKVSLHSKMGACSKAILTSNTIKLDVGGIAKEAGVPIESSAAGS
jgi:3-hydroxyacyl-CoA dehydrogenase